MDNSGAGSKSPNTSLSFRYNANNEELEELYDVCEDDPPTPQFDVSPGVRSENASPKRGEKSSSILDKYFKSMRTEKLDDIKPVETKVIDESRSSPKEVSLSPMKEYLNRLGKRNTSEVLTEVKEGSNETWKIFHDFKFKITQAVEDMKTRSLEETKEKSVPRENSVSDSEENSVIKDSDQSVGDTDNQVSSLDSSMQNLSEMTQPITAKATERDTSLPDDGKQNSDDSEDTHKNLVHSYSAEETRNCKDIPLEVESGVEALEDGIDGFGDMSKVEDCPHTCKPDTPTHCPPLNCVNKSNPERKPKNYFLNFKTYFLTFLLFVNYVLFPNCNIWNGFLFGIWFFCFASNLKQWVLDTYFSEGEPFSRSFIQLNRSSAMPVYTIPSVKEHRPLKKHEGWINHYRYPDYDPFTYHVNKTTTAFMKLEGCNLRISYTTTKIGKRALWDEKIEQVVFYQHRLYNLTGARLILLPKGLVRRRQWSKKYPICIILNEKETIQVLEKENADKKAADGVADKRKENLQEMESAETNTSPEKKRKFVWRRREKSISHSESEAGKEGLRHRLVRKMHRDKKPDTVPTCPDPAETAQQDDVVFHDAETELGPRGLARDDDDDLDEDLARIKDFLEDAELEGGAEGASAAECEWSLHVKQSRDKHSRLFLFGRTGRDKHEWYRRLSIAISEASAAADDSPTEERSGSEREGRDSIEMAVYKIAEKETVAFARSTTKGTDSISEAVTVTVPSQTLPHDSMSYEKTFWPYFLKIMQIHETTLLHTSDVGVMCQIEPSPQHRHKGKKKRKDPKSSSPSCECRALPAELSWVNTVLARVVFDVMRDPALLARVQRRIQKKLNTLKLPSFMSPLLVTELSLSGACPLVERVSAPAWDERGVWLDADMRYEGGAYITILTQINLMKLKEKNVSLDENMMNTTDQMDESEPSAKEAKVVLGERHLRKCKPAIYDSEVEDSAESSSDDESPPLQPVDSDEGAPPPVDTTGVADAPAASSKKKFLRIVDRIATNKYFQTVTDYKYVKRAMEGLSNTDIKLQVEVHGLEGRLAINLPPPPHDRLWIGFRTNPQLVLKARPAVGARSVRIAHVTNWIEAKLTKEFEKVLVLPNMEDIAIDVMTPTPIQFE